MILRCKNISKIYGTNPNSIVALKNTTMEFNVGIHVITGNSGSGKSTLLSILGGLLIPSTGNVFLDKDINLYNESDNIQAQIRNNKFGFIFQSYNLIPELNILDNISLPCLLSTSRKKCKEKAIYLAEILGISNNLYKMPNELSGGQQQRAAIARALINEPNIIFADEPTGNLDTKNSINVMELLISMLNNKTLIMVTHNKELIKYSNYSYNMIDGNFIKL